MATAETARLIASLELQDKNFTRGLKAAEKRLGHIDKRLGAFSGAVNRNVARGIDTLVTKGIDAGQAVIQAAIDQESAIVGIRKTVDSNVDQIVEDLKKMSTETGSTFEELASIAETGGAMGIDPKDIAAFTKQVAILGATTNVTIEDAATAIGQMGTVMGITGDEFDNLAASLVDLGNKGNSTEAQILEIAKRSGAAAKTVGIAKNEFLGWASAAANLGLGEELAGTALQKFFVDTQKILARGGDDLKTMGKVAGMTGEQFKKAFAKDATGALHSFIDGLKDLNAEQRVLAIEDLFGKGSGMTRLLLGMSEALDDPTSGLTASLETNAEAWKAGTAAQEEADKRFKSSEFAFKRLNNAVNLAAATIGTELLPVLVDLAEEGIGFLMKPATQKGIKDFAVGLGKGIRGLASAIASINWGAVADFLSKAAGFAGDLVGWFTKMPDWAQAFLIGGFVATKLPVIGDLFSGLASGLIKGILGINAGIVNVNGPVAGMGGGAPVPGAGGGMGKLMNLLRTGITVGIAAASIYALAQQFKVFIDDVGKYQADLLEKVNQTSEQGFEETIGNLQATNKTIKNMNPLENVLAGVFGGSEIVKNYEMAADRIVKQLESGELDRDEITTAIAALDETLRLNPEVELPGVESAIERLIKAYNAGPKQGPTKPETKPRVSGVGDRPSPGNAGQFKKNIGIIGFDKWITKAGEIKNAVVNTGADQKAELGNLKNAIVTLRQPSEEQKNELSNIKNAQATLKTAVTNQTSQQSAELGNIKNATATMDTNTATGLSNVKNATTTHDMNSTFRSAAQITSTGGTTTAVNTNAAATRRVAPPIVNQLSVIGGNIVGAIWAARPIIQSTNVVNNYTRTQRTGSSSGSRASGTGPDI